MATTTSSTTTRLPLKTKLAYGAGDIGPAIESTIKPFFLLNFLINVAGLEPAAAGIVLMVAKIWDAVNDPLVGWLTDHTHTRLGRRRPWLLAAALPFGLAWFLLWLVPPLSLPLKIVYYTVVMVLLDTALTAVLVPYTALTPELTPDYDERTSLTSIRMRMSIAASLVAGFLHGQIIGAFPNDPYLAHALTGALWGVAMALPCFIVVAGTREPKPAASAAAAEAGPGFWRGLQLVFANRAFVLVLIVYALSWIVLQFIQTNLLLYVKDWVLQTRSEAAVQAQFSFVILALQASAFVWIIFWTRMSARLGKKAVYYIGAGVLIVVLTLVGLMPRGQLWMMYALAVAGGAGVAVLYLVPWSMVPDVMELDELETGQRREGVYYGFFAFLQKWGVGAAAAIAGWALQLTGYVKATPGQPLPDQPEAALTALRVLIGPVCAVLLAVSLVAVYLYPITRERHAQIRGALAARAAQAAGSLPAG